MSMFSTITRAALDAAGLPTPAPTTDAEEFAAAAIELRRSLAATIPPTLESATASTAAKMVAQRADFATLHPARLEAAGQLVNIAEARVEASWRQAAQAARAAFAAAFDSLAAEFGKEIDARGIGPDNIEAYRRDPGAGDVFALAGRLDALAAIRDEFASQSHDRRDGTHSDNFERLTRHMVILDRRAITSPPRHTNPQTEGRGPQHWAAIHRSQWVRAGWQELPQQREQVALTKSHS